MTRNIGLKWVFQTHPVLHFGAIKWFIWMEKQKFAVEIIIIHQLKCLRSILNEYAFSLISLLLLLMLSLFHLPSQFVLYFYFEFLLVTWFYKIITSCLRVLYMYVCVYCHSHWKLNSSDDERSIKIADVSISTSRLYFLLPSRTTAAH